MTKFYRASEVIKRRIEQLKSEYGFQKINHSEKGRFYLQDYYIRTYRRMIFKKYGSSMANAISHIYMCLASKSDYDGASWPSLALIMQETCISNKNTLIKSIRLMMDLNMLRYVRGGGKGSSNAYLLINYKSWKDLNSIKPEFTVSKPDNILLQNSDTGRTVFKDYKYKDNNLNKTKSINTDTDTYTKFNYLGISLDTKLLPSPTANKVA